MLISSGTNRDGLPQAGRFRDLLARAIARPMPDSPIRLAPVPPFGILPEREKRGRAGGRDGGCGHRGGRGIGRAVATALAGAGARVTMLGRSRAPLQPMVEAATRRLRRSRRDRRAGAGAGARALGALRHPRQQRRRRGDGAVLPTDGGLLRRMLALNLESVVTRRGAVLPGMLERGFGRVVSVASTAGLKGYAYVSAYSAAKHAVIGLTRALALEVARSGVTVNAVCPGYTDTDLVRDSVERIRRQDRAQRGGDAFRPDARQPAGAARRAGRGGRRRRLAVRPRGGRRSRARRSPSPAGRCEAWRTRMRRLAQPCRAAATRRP